MPTSSPSQQYGNSTRLRGGTFAHVQGYAYGRYMDIVIPQYSNAYLRKGNRLLPLSIGDESVSSRCGVSSAVGRGEDVTKFFIPK